MPVENILIIIIIMSFSFGCAGWFFAYSYGHIRRYGSWDMISDLGIGIFFGGAGITAVSIGIISYFLFR